MLLPCQIHQNEAVVITTVFATFQGKAGVCSVKLILGAIQVNITKAVSLEI